MEGHWTEGAWEPYRDLLTIDSGGWGETGAPHPLNGSEFIPMAISTRDLRTGLPVTFADVFARDPRPQVVACALRFGSAPDSGDSDDLLSDPEEWTRAFTPYRFALTERGIRFFSDGFPHAWGAMNWKGPTLPYSVLLRDGYLRRDSPVKRAWEGVSTAAAHTEACPSGSEKTWWEEDR